jgi:hypothetical protein
MCYRDKKRVTRHVPKAMAARQLRVARQSFAAVGLRLIGC